VVLPWLRWRIRDNAQASAVLFYNEMLATLARNSLFKLPGQTPIEFARETGNTQVGLITNFYNLVRFRGSSLTSLQWQELQEALKQLRKQKTTKVAVTKFAFSKVLLVVTIVSACLLLGFVGLYFYNEYKWGRESSTASVKVLEFQPESFQGAISSIVKTVRTESIDGSDLYLSVLERQRAGQGLVSGLNPVTPWENNLSVKGVADQAYWQNLSALEDIALLERAATSQTFNVDSLNNAGAKRSFEPTLIGNATTIMLWKAHTFFQAKEYDKCQREIMLVLSLGERLREDYAFFSMLIGCQIIARATNAMGLYYRERGETERANRWFSATKNYQQHRERTLNLYQQIHRTGVSDKHLRVLRMLVYGNERALAQEAIIAIGRNWLLNPNNILWGVSLRRELLLEEIVHSDDKVLAKNAAQYLAASMDMKLSTRIKRYLELHQNW
jgi:hypothetical protein